MSKDQVILKIIETIQDNPLYWQPFQLVQQAESMGLKGNDADDAVARAWVTAKPDWNERVILRAIAKCRYLGIV